jgi:RimJ/RimL family protein N-acetyltransferase
MPHELRVLTSADADAYNETFARGATQYPTLLRIDPADVRARPFSTEPSSEGCTLIVHENGRWLGMGTIEREQGRVKRRHVAWIVRMLVLEPNAGIGRAILRELKRRALSLPDVEKLNLTVAAHNAAAIHLYTSEGFVPFSREEDAFRAGAECVDELSMTLRLAAGRAGEG